MKYYTKHTRSDRDRQLRESAEILRQYELRNARLCGDMDELAIARSQIEALAKQCAQLKSKNERLQNELCTLQQDAQSRLVFIQEQAKHTKHQSSLIQSLQKELEIVKTANALLSRKR